MKSKFEHEIKGNLAGRFADSFLGEKIRPSEELCSGGDNSLVIGNGMHQLYKAEDMRLAIRRSGDETRLVLSDADRLGPIRDLALVPEDFEQRCEELISIFPNFSGYIREHLLPEFALCRAGDGVLKFSPTVLLGEPGIGKTYFASVFCEIFELPNERVNLETASAGFEILGLAKGWASSAPGKLFKWCVGSCKTVNGVFIFEELDKAKGDDRFHPTASLIQLLENTTANSIKDSAVPELPINLTPVNYFFTANSMDGVSGPILSRLVVVEIPPPTEEQVAEILQRQYEKLLGSLRPDVDRPILGDQAIAALRKVTPRRQRLLLRQALGDAIQSKRNELEVKSSAESLPSRKIGFV